MKTTYLTGYISVAAALLSGNRKICRVYLDKGRLEKIKRSDYYQTEKRQYAFIKSRTAASGIKTTMLEADEFAARFETDSGGFAVETGERRFTPVEELLLMEKPYLAAIDGIEDPYNLGHILRSFYASGVDGVVISARDRFVSTPTVVKSSAGASEYLKIAAVKSMEDFCDSASQAGIKLYATTSEKGSENLYSTKFARPLCVFFGGERRGISMKIIQRCDSALSIIYPRPTDIALSASSAAAVIAFEIGRRILSQFQLK